MPPTTPPSPILIPRPPLPTPLSPTLFSTLQSALLSTHPNPIPALRTALETATRAEQWQEKVKARTMQLLKEKEKEKVDWRWEELVGVIVGEARGVDEEGEEGEEGDERDGEEGKKERVDIRFPEKAIEEAGKIVKGCLGSKVELEAEGKGFWD